MYVALTYIGKNFTPGEIVPDGAFDRDRLNWLLEAGALRVEGAASGVPTLRDKLNDTLNANRKLTVEEVQENFRRQMAAMGYNPDGTPLNQEEEQEEAEEEAPVAEADEESSVADALDDLDDGDGLDVVEAPKVRKTPRKK